MPDKERRYLKDSPRARRRQKKLIEAMRKRRAMKKAGVKTEKELTKRKQSVKETREMLRRSKKGIPEAASSMLKQLGRKKKTSSKKLPKSGKLSLYEQYMMAKKARRLKKKK